MGEIRIKDALDRFKQDGDLQELTLAIAYIGNYSIHSQQNATLMYDKIRKYCPKPAFECVYYDGEHGEYHLFDFDPNNVSKKSLLIEVKARLQSECYIDPDGIDKAMQNVYLIDTNMMRKVVTMSEYTVRVTEISSRLVTVDVLNAEDAIDMVQQQYADGEIVFDFNDYDDVKFEVER